MSKLDESKMRSEWRETKSKKLIKAKKFLSDWCGISGEYSALELLICAAAKCDYVVRGDRHPHAQLMEVYYKIKLADKPKKVVNKCKTKKDFYSSRAWKILRYQAFEKYGNRCCCCGGTPADGLAMHVDHIKPRSTHPDLALSLDNLQILCEDCNVGKINQWDTDWRP